MRAFIDSLILAGGVSVMFRAVTTDGSAGILLYVIAVGMFTLALRRWGSESTR